jgi:hypothetical protein
MRRKKKERKEKGKENKMFGFVDFDQAHDMLTWALTMLLGPIGNGLPQN